MPPRRKRSRCADAPLPIAAAMRRDPAIPRPPLRPKHDAGPDAAERRNSSADSNGGSTNLGPLAGPTCRRSDRRRSMPARPIRNPQPQPVPTDWPAGPGSRRSARSRPANDDRQRSRSVRRWRSVRVAQKPRPDPIQHSTSWRQQSAADKAAAAKHQPARAPVDPQTLAQTGSQTAMTPNRRANGRDRVARCKCADPTATTAARCRAAGAAAKTPPRSSRQQPDAKDAGPANTPAQTAADRQYAVPADQAADPAPVSPRRTVPGKDQRTARIRADRSAQ